MAPAHLAFGKALKLPMALCRAICQRPFDEVRLHSYHIAMIAPTITMKRMNTVPAEASSANVRQNAEKNFSR